MQMRARGANSPWSSAATQDKSITGNVFQVLKQLLREHRPATVPDLPPFTGGAVGYFSYDVVRQLENIGEHAKDDLPFPTAS